METTIIQRTFIHDISASTPGEVLLRGWIYRLRVLGKTSFVILRDCSGQAQCVGATEFLKDVHLKAEDVIEVRGVLRLDPRSAFVC
jgi:nondiscriminating aspartyl-tRNA synthetase